MKHEIATRFLNTASILGLLVGLGMAVQGGTVGVVGYGVGVGATADLVIRNLIPSLRRLSEA